MCFLVAVLIGFLVVGCDEINQTNSLKKKAADSSTVQTVNVLRVQREIQAVETAIFFGKLVPNREVVLDLVVEAKSKLSCRKLATNEKKAKNLPN